MILSETTKEEFEGIKMKKQKQRFCFGMKLSLLKLIIKFFVC